MDVEEAIEVQAAGEPPSAVTELFLAGCTVPGLATLSLQLVPFLNLRSLSLNCCKLGSLQSFPALPNLRCLELADNQLTGNLEPLYGASLLSLRELNLADNLIENLGLASLSRLPSLRRLDLSNNPAASAANYRETLMAGLLPCLLVLDGRDADGNEVGCDDSDSGGDDEAEEHDALAAELEGMQARNTASPHPPRTLPAPSPLRWAGLLRAVRRRGRRGRRRASARARDGGTPAPRRGEPRARPDGRLLAARAGAHATAAHTLARGDTCAHRHAGALPPRYRHVAAALPPPRCRRHVAAALPPRCRRHVAATLPPRCRRHVAAALPPPRLPSRCRHVAAATPPRCRRVAAASVLPGAGPNPDP